MEASAFRALCTIVWHVARVEFRLGRLPKRLERQSQMYWFEVYNGDRLPKAGTRRKLEPRQLFVRKLMDALTEIDRTFRLMRHLELYAAKPPRLKGEPTKLDFLGYLIESHLHETYILRERIQVFSKLLERAYRTDRSARRIAAHAKRIRRGAERTLKHAVAVRSEHVHVRRHRVPDIERVEFMREFGSYAPPAQKPDFDRAYAAAYRELHRQRLEQMREVNESCQHLLDFVGANALSILLRRKLTEFVFPSDLNSGSNKVVRGRPAEAKRRP